MFKNGKKSEKNHADGVELQNLRTYEDDLKTVIKSDNISTSKILLAEQEKKRTLVSQNIPININESIQAEKARKGSLLGKNTFIVLISTILIGFGAYAVYYNFSHIKPYFKNLSFKNDNSSAEVIISNKKIVIDSLGKTKGEIIRLMHESSSDTQATNTGEVVEIIIQKDEGVETNENKEIERVQIDSSDLFKLVNAHAPESLIRSLRPEISLGFHILEKPEPFIVLKSESVNQSYSGLLEWENNMGADLQEIFIEGLTISEPVMEEVAIENNTAAKDNNNLQEDASSAATSTTATSTSVPTSPEPTVASSTAAATSTASTAEIPAKKIEKKVLPTFDIRNFIDVVISNKDTRAIVDSEGKVRFFYSIVDGENIVFTTNKVTLDLLLNRINQVNLIR